MSNDGSLNKKTNGESVDTTDYRKPRPKIDVWNVPFWDAARRHTLMAQEDHEGHVWLPPGPVSPFTRSPNWQWKTLSGKGTVVSWVVFHQQYFPGFTDEMPYNVATVELDEGPRLFTNIVNIANEDIRIGMRVVVTFRDADENLSLPVFQPITGGE